MKNATKLSENEKKILKPFVQMYKESLQQYDETIKQSIRDRWNILRIPEGIMVKHPEKLYKEILKRKMSKLEENEDEEK